MALEPVIKSVTLRCFKSFREETVRLDNPTFLVGPNGSGKSNFVSAIAFVADAMSVPLQTAFDNQGGVNAVRNRQGDAGRPPDLALGVEFAKLNGDLREARYAFRIKALKDYGFEVVREQCRVTTSTDQRHWFDRNGAEVSSNVDGVRPSLEPSALGLPVVGGSPCFAPVLRALSSVRTYKIETGPLREMQEPDSGIGLKKDGRNAASVLQRIGREASSDLARICELLATMVPHTTGVRPKKCGSKLSLEFTQTWGANKEFTFEAFSMSDGALRALGLLMAVFQTPAPSLIAIEEPEATIHPEALGTVLDLLRHAAGRTQVIVTTHSPEVLDEKCVEERHLRIVECREGATRVAPLGRASREALNEHLMGAGELLRSNALRAEPLLEEAPVQQLQLFETLDDQDSADS